MKWILSLLLGCCSWLALSAAAASSNDPLDALKCAVVREEESPWGVRLLIEVRNSGAQALEPLSFRVTHRPKKKKAAATETDIRRVAFPFVDRSGRAVPAKGKERYWIQVAQPSEDGRFEAQVTQADPSDGAPVPQPTLEIGKPTQADVPYVTGQKVSLASVRLKNAAARDVDLVFLASFQQPRDGQALLGVRIRAASERDWIIGHLPAVLEFSEEAGYEPTRVSKLELVDWSWVDAPDPAAAAKLFRSAYDGWARWEAPCPQLSGRFVEHDWGDDHDLTIAGTFQIDAEGRVSIEVDPLATKSTAKDDEGLVRRSFDELLFDVRRPSADEVLAANRLRLVANDAFEVDGSGWWRERSNGWSGSRSGADGEYLPNFTVRDGRIVRSGNRSGLDGYEWDTRTLNDRWVLTERRNKANQWVDTYEYDTLDELIVPTVYRHRFGFVDRGSRSFRELKLSELRIVATAAVPASAPQAPSGPGAAALREAWNTGHRYPDEPRTLRARFEVRTPATDGVWQGNKELHGSVELVGFRGFRCNGSPWREFHVDVENKLPEATRRALGTVVIDRLHMWRGRDFNGRDSFEETFAGAVIEGPNKAGEFTIDVGAIAVVSVKDGRVVKKQARSGVTHEYTWSPVGDTLLVARTRSGGEQLDGRFTKLGDEYVPTTLEFQGVFGADWGPETVVLSDVRIE